MRHLQPEHQQQYAGCIRYWCGDESRVGLLTVQRRKLTALGVRPVGQVQWQLLYRWIYGVVEPLSGEHLLLEFSHLDGHCFEQFLQSFAQAYPDELHLIQLDNSMVHRAQSLQIPSNVILLFQPPYCPEVNPIERLWQDLKQTLQWKPFEGLSELQSAITHWVRRLSARRVKSLTGWDWLVDALCVAGI